MSTLTTTDPGVDVGPVPWRDRLIISAWSLVLSIVVLAPLLGGRGGVLRGDLLFVPRQPFKGAWLGLDGSVPHNVPLDFLVAIGNWIAPGDLIQKALLVLALFLAGTGAAAAAARLGLVGQTVAATFFVWNPWVYERLASGNLGMLFGYAALGWVVWAAMRPAVADGLMGLAPLVVALALAGWTSPTFGVIATLVAVCAVAARGFEVALWALLAGLLVNLPWIVPGLLRPGGILPESTGVGAFAANPDTKLGVFGSLLTLGGIWDPTAAAPGRSNAIVAAVALMVTLLGILGAALAWGRHLHGPIIGLTVAAVIGLAVALLGAYGSTRSAIDAIAENIPGGVLLRDGHAWIAPLALLLAFGLGSLVVYLWELGGNVVGAIVAVAAVVAPIALLPGLAFALDGHLANEHYPGDWWKTRSTLAAKDRAGIAVLPLGGYRDYKWNQDGEVANPAPYFFLGNVLADDSRTVNGTVVNGDDAGAEMLRVAAGKKGSLVSTLLANGYDTILVERGVRAPLPKISGPDVKVAEKNKSFIVYDLTGTLGKADRPPALPILIGDVLAAALVLGAVGLVFLRRRTTAAALAGGAYGAEDFRRPEDYDGEPGSATVVLPTSATVPTVDPSSPQSYEALPPAYEATPPAYDAYAGYDPASEPGYDLGAAGDAETSTDIGSDIRAGIGADAPTEYVVPAETAGDDSTEYPADYEAPSFDAGAGDTALVDESAVVEGSLAEAELGNVESSETDPTAEYPVHDADALGGDQQNDEVNDHVDPVNDQVAADEIGQGDDPDADPRTP